MDNQNCMTELTKDLYFITNGTVSSLDVFSDKAYRDCLLSSFQYCSQHKGLRIHAYTILSSRFYAIVSVKEGFQLSNIMRDMKRHTSSTIVKSIQQDPEGKWKWMLKLFSQAAQVGNNNNQWKVWEAGYESDIIPSRDALEERLNFIHELPVNERIVWKQEQYLYSSARNYVGEEGLIDVEVLWKKKGAYKMRPF